MELPGGQIIRQRRGVKEVVQELDSFVKITDDAREEPLASKGLCIILSFYLPHQTHHYIIVSVLSFSLICVLLVHQIYKYFSHEVRYKFSVDVDYEEKPIMDIDLIIATPCNNLAIMPVGVDDANDLLLKSPSRFEMTETEIMLWEALQKIHRENFKPGTPLRRLNQNYFVSDNIEIGLEKAANEKQALEFKELEQKHKEALEKGEDPIEQEGHVFMAFIGNGMGVLQVISGSGDEKDEGTACRVNGKFPVQKGSGGRITISVGRALPIGNILQHLGSHNHGNISHRIERLNFGDHIWGLVTPLSGMEQIATKTGTEYKYFMKIVPTRIYDNYLFGGPVATFQYAVTYVKKEARSEEDHVHDSIIFDYEFAATVVEVHPATMSPVQFFLRICSVIGGIFATSKFLETYLSKFFVTCAYFFSTKIIQKQTTNGVHSELKN